jgi:hypothetical protein
MGEAEEGELCLDIDDEGRIATSGHLDYSSRSFPHFLQSNPPLVEKLKADCDLADEGEDLDATFWLPCTMKPRCSLETLADSIFKLHTHNVPFDRESSGCEWWVQVRSQETNNAAASAEDDETVGESIPFHWDKDETLGAAYSAYVHPHLSTVTYLSEYGAPTVVLNARMTVDGGLDLSNRICQAQLSYPQVGKHFVFDGRYLHAAPQHELLAPRLTPKGNCPAIRVTFLANIWLNHQPISIAQLPSSLLKQMSKISTKDLLSHQHQVVGEVAEFPIEPKSKDLREVQFPLKMLDGVHVALHLPHCCKLDAKAVSDGDVNRTYSLKFENELCGEIRADADDTEGTEVHEQAPEPESCADHSEAACSAGSGGPPPKRARRAGS